ncbi:hypothetical protein OMCYN_01581 [cyanobiont of Ornithocercus magnificus]|nr:hypothetical protein OMCYN_01581 [cyanobiont of Ornithocercus magnificus]
MVLELLHRNSSALQRLRPFSALLVAGTISVSLLIDTLQSLRAQGLPSVSQNFSQRSFVADAVARSAPAVVTLETQRTVHPAELDRGIPRGMTADPFFRQFFGFPRSFKPKQQVELGQGSGIIFDSKGLILTNAHVVEGSERLTVGLSDGRRTGGRVIGRDSLTDLAVVQLDDSAGPWPIAVLGNSDRLRVGDWAIAVGNPFGLESTVTLGIVSGLSRSSSQLGVVGKRLDLIQTDAAINPGSSGGPLLNASGEVVGINTLVRFGPGAGLGFAIPINRARLIAQQLVSLGHAKHPMLGIGLSTASASNLGETAPLGALIQSVVAGGPASRAGLKVGDVLIALEGRDISGPAEVISTIDKHGAGQPLRATVLRDGQTLVVSVIPQEMRAMRSR